MMAVMKFIGYLLLLVVLGLVAGAAISIRVFGDVPADAAAAHLLFWMTFAIVLGLGFFYADRIL